MKNILTSLATSRHLIQINGAIFICFLILGFASCNTNFKVNTTASSKDKTSNEKESSEVAVTIIEKVSATSANGSYAQGTTLVIQILFDNPVNVTGTPTLELKTSTSSTTKIPYYSGTGTSTLSFTYEVQSTHSTTLLDYTSTASLTLNSGSIVDQRGTSVTLELPKPGDAGSLSHSNKIAIDNDSPTMTNIESITIRPGETSSNIAFQIYDQTSALSCSSSSLSMSSSNTTLIPNNSVAWSGTYPNCTAQVTANSGSQGTTMITFTVTDPTGASAAIDFPVFVSTAYVYGQTSSVVNSSFSNALGRMSSIVVNGRLYLGDIGKISVWNSMPQQDDQIPDFVIGSFSRNSLYLTTNSNELSIGAVRGLASNGTNLVVSDYGNHRVLIWHRAPTHPRTIPDIVLGQSDFIGKSINRGSSASSATLYAPVGVAIIGSKLLVSDYGNNRVLLWNTIPTTSGTPADLVIGQPDFTTTSDAVTSSKFFRPTGIASDGNRLYIVDSQNSRVMGWNTIPTTSSVAADFVLGQNSFTTNTSNNPTLSSFQGFMDGGIVTDGQKLLLGDSARILVWNTLPTVTGQAADYVIGQSSSTAMTTNQDITWSFDKVYNLFLYGTKLIVSDFFIFGATTGTWIWNTIPTSYNQPKDRLLKTLSTSIPKWASGYRTRIFGTKLYRTASNAVYIWNTIPTSRDTPPDVVLGQPDFNSSTLNYNGLSASSLANPSDVVVIGTKLIVSDDSNQRLLVWNSIPTTNNQAADVVLGQANFTSNAQNRGGSPAANTISGPNNLATDGTKLFACDGYNKRILIWNTVPISNGANANIVVGQPNMTAYTAVSSASQSTFYYYYMSITIASGKLIVSEQQGNRVLIWNTVPTTNGAAADVVLGQSDFTSITANYGGLSASSLWGPWSATVYSNKLYVLDSNNHRVLVWNSIPTSSTQPADVVLFQPNFTSNNAHGFGLGYSPFDVYTPFSLMINGGKMYVSESNRTLVLDHP